MKNVTLLLLWFLSATTVYSQSCIQLLNPKKGNWNKKAGNILVPRITLTPAGVYCNVDVEFTVSTMNTEFQTSPDTLEAEWFFNLPENAVLHDAYLWIFGGPVRAKLYEILQAKMIYESLVQRRVDPLIIYEKENKNFEARIYPVHNNMPRHVKISYLIPFQFRGNRVGLPFDLGILNNCLTDAYKSDLEITIHSNALLGTPEMPVGSLIQTNGNSYTYLIKGTTKEMAELQQISFLHPAQNEFLFKQPVDATTGFYQFVVQPTTAVSGRKVVYIIDHEAKSNNSINNELQLTQALNALKQKVKFQLHENDSFNILFTSSNSANLVSPVWVKGDSASFQSVFSQVKPVSNANSPFFLALQKAIQFISQNGNEGSIFVLSNAGNAQNSLSIQNQLIKSLLELSESRFPIHVVDYNTTYQSQWNSGTYYYNNEYFYSNLCQLSGGAFYSQLKYSQEYYYSNQQFYASLNTLVSRALNNMGNRLEYFDISREQTGYCYQPRNLTTGIIMPTGLGFAEAGRYSGNGDITVKVNYGLNGVHQSYTKTLSPLAENDSFTQKIWAGSYISEFYNKGRNQDFKATIVNLSRQFHVLSRQTAFLALEPDTTTPSNSDNGGTPASTVSLTEYEKVLTLQVKAYPNPFTEQLTLEIPLDAFLQHKQCEIKVTNLLGQEIRKFEMHTGADDLLTILFDGMDDKGTALREGIYFLHINIEGVTKMVKVFKSGG